MAVLHITKLQVQTKAYKIGQTSQASEYIPRKQLEEWGALQFKKDISLSHWATIRRM
jgi:hypothetical protein